MIDDVPVLVLPLVHHLVEQGVECLRHSVPPNVTAADHDLGPVIIAARGAVVTEPALHSPRDAQAYAAQLSGKVERVVLGMPANQLLDERGIVGMRLLARTTNGRAPLYWVRENRPPCRRALRPGAPAGEGDDRCEDFRGCRQEVFVQPQLASAKAHHHRAVAGEPAAFDSPQPQRAEPRQ